MRAGARSGRHCSRTQQRSACGGAVAATLMMAMMWFAELPLAQTTASGEPSGSTNRLVDYHVIYALAAAFTNAGHVWGLGRW